MPTESADPLSHLRRIADRLFLLIGTCLEMSIAVALMLVMVLVVIEHLGVEPLATLAPAEPAAYQQLDREPPWWVVGYHGSIAGLSLQQAKVLSALLLGALVFVQGALLLLKVTVAGRTDWKPRESDL